MKHINPYNATYNKLFESNGHTGLEVWIFNEFIKMMKDGPNSSKIRISNSATSGLYSMSIDEPNVYMSFVAVVDDIGTIPSDLKEAALDNGLVLNSDELNNDVLDLLNLSETDIFGIEISMSSRLLKNTAFIDVPNNIEEYVELDSIKVDGFVINSDNSDWYNDFKHYIAVIGLTSLHNIIEDIPNKFDENIVILFNFDNMAKVGKLYYDPKYREIHPTQEEIESWNFNETFVRRKFDESDVLIEKFNDLSDRGEVLRKIPPVINLGMVFINPDIISNDNVVNRSEYERYKTEYIDVFKRPDEVKDIIRILEISDLLLLAKEETNLGLLYYKA